MPMFSSRSPIAVIGIGCWYPGAKTPLQLWENILARRKQFRIFPEHRLSMTAYYDADPKAPDKTYGRKAAVIDGFTFDWSSKRIPQSTFRATDTAHWLALETALNAVKDTGYNKDTLPRERTGVIIGNTLNGEQTRANALRLRWPYVRRVLEETARQNGVPEFQAGSFIAEMEKIYKSAFPPVDEDTLAGGLSNTIAGRICNYLNLYGGGYTIDGACSSGLLAVATACDRLTDGTLDLAIAGGVDISLDPFEMVGFSKAGALTASEMTVYDRRGSGFIPGEGCGMVVLKSLDTANRDGDHIYGAIHGWGISSDGGGTSITAPSARGQAKAIARAHAHNGLDPATLDFIEGHGTGTAVGDRVELSGIAMAMNNSATEHPETDPIRTCGITSLKSIVGHTKAASGIGGFIKSLMGVNRRVLPPTAGCRYPHPIFDAEAKTLYPILQGKRLPSDQVVRAGVSSMGFGGINCHIAIASENGPSDRLRPDLEEQALMASCQDSEIFVITADTQISLNNRIADISKLTKGISQAEMLDLAAEMSREVDGNAQIRAAIIADTPESLSERLKMLSEIAMDPISAESDFPPIARAQDNIWLGRPTHPARIGFLFPGQGSQHLNMGRVLVQRHPWARKQAELAEQCLKSFGAGPVYDMIYRPVDRSSGENQEEAWLQMLSETEYAQPAICLGSALWYHFLGRIGIHPAAAGGHSLGELGAFHAAGAIETQDLFRLAAIRGQAMSKGNSHTGAMISLRCSRETAESMLEKISSYLILANINSPAQMVLSGETTAVRSVMKLASEQGIINRPLNVSGAFHSRLAARAAETLSGLNDLPIPPEQLHCRLFTGIDGGEVPPGIDLAEHFSRQVLAQVNFVEMIHAMASECTLFLEMGPGRVLSNLVRDILSNGGPRCLPMESSPDSARDMNQALAAAFCHGANIHWPSLYENRLVRPFIPANQRRFIESACETGLATKKRPSVSGMDTNSHGKLEIVMSEISELSANQISRYLSRRGDFIADIIRSDLKHLPDGHLPAPEHVAPAPVEKFSLPVQTVSASKEMLQKHLYDLITRMTGFPKESLTPSLHLVDDLNLDSIKSADLLVNFAVQSGFTWPGDPSIFANASLEKIIAAGDRILDGFPPTPPEKESTPEITKPHETQDAEKRVYAAIHEITGLPEEKLTRNLRLFDDLKIDAENAATLISRLCLESDPADKSDTEHLTNAKLGAIIEVLEKCGAAPAPVLETPKPEKKKVLHLLMTQASRITGFAVQTLIPHARLEEDLNMGPEMIKLLITRTGKALGISPQVDLEKIGLKSLEEVAGILARIASISNGDPDPIQDIVGAELNLESLHWVRNYSVLPQPSPPAVTAGKWGKRAGDRWQTTRVIILRGEGTDEVAEALEAALYRQGARVECATFENAAKTAIYTGNDRAHLIGILPMTLPAGDQDASLQAMVRHLAVMAAPPVNDISRRRTTIAFVQFGGGFFGMQPRYAHLNRCGAVAIGAGIHHERQDLRVRVLDFSPVLAPKKIADTVMKEMQTPNAYVAAGYDVEETRRTLTPSLIFPAICRPRNITWTAEDVILVTGGARGITAACALKTAKATGCQMALIGSTPDPGTRPGHPANAEILSTLNQYESLGLKARYFSCDVTDQESVSETLARIETDLGRITGVLHGAGKNIPRRIQHTSEADAVQEIGPKVLGIHHILSVLKKHPPKLIIGMTSIIGITGMPGNAWYGFSNEALEITLHRFGMDHPETQTFCIAFSIWRDQGMGERMGSVTQLRRKGISAISPDEGTDRFLYFFFNDPGVHQVVVTARIGGLDTWQEIQSPIPPGYRYLEKHILSTPGVESVFHAHLCLEKDAYLADHQFQGSYLFPTVFGLEAMAQVAAHASATGKLHRVRIENIRLQRPITVDPEKGADIIIHAIANEPSQSSGEIRIECGIIKRHTGLKSDFFSATFIFNPDITPEIQQVVLPGSPTLIDPVADLYRETLLFQGTLFQRISKIHSLKSKGDTLGEALFETHAETQETNARCYSDPDHHTLCLGDPFFRDSLLQSAALLIPQDTSLPVAIERLDICALPSAATTPIYGFIRMQSRTDDEIHTTVLSVDATGRVIEELQDYTLKVLKHHKEYPTVKDLLTPQNRDQRLLENRLNQILESMDLLTEIPELAYIPDIHAMEKSLRRQKETPLLLAAARRLTNPETPGVTASSLKWSESGRPEIIGPASDGIHLSLSHDERLCAAVAGHAPQGIDIAPITPRERWRWEAILGNIHIPLLDRLIEEKYPLDQAGTRLWAVVEAMKKATGRTGFELEIIRIENDAVLFSEKNAPQPPWILSFPVLFTWGPEKIMALTVEKRSETERAAKPDFRQDADYERLFAPPAYELSAGGTFGRQRFILRRPVTFKPSANLSRTLYFSNYMHWMGECREASAWPVLSKISRQFASGKWGGVTNFGHIKILGEATTSDCVEIRMWASDNSGPENSTMTLTFDFRKMKNGGSPERLAWCTLQTTWVEILGPGKVRIAPYPDYYNAFIQNMLITSENRETSGDIAEPLSNLEERTEDPLIYSSPKGPSVLPVLHEQIFETSLSHANLVGNIYYANYYDWQGQIRDRYFHGIIPDYFRGTGEKGELICLECRVDHLREAMPFDRILVRLSLKWLRRAHVMMNFDYLRILPNSQLEKIAYGEHRAVWAIRDRNGKPQPAPFPERIHKAFERAIAGQHHTPA